MYFKKLEIVGFKSFFHKTTLNFEPGITAIVGPNGCGKSNIFDAIRWVLGEQSVKSLRGSDMQDVIFGGTDTKEPLSMAEVTLTFDNSAKFFNLDYGEVAVTRRLFRSGESEYLLNKSPVRLKDILDLLMGTGIGAESYSLIAQGKIDLILSSRPEDRRLVFDEASGITKYKTQKREAERRLEDTEQNLLRVNDIITEVKRQISSLERQANKARRYQEVFEELKSKELGLASLQKEELEAEKQRISKQSFELKDKQSALYCSIKEQESLLALRNKELKDFEDRILDIKNQVLSLESLFLRDNERISFSRERIEALAADKKYLEGQIEQNRARLAADEEKLNILKSQYLKIGEAIEEKIALLKENEEKLCVISASIKTSLENIASAKKAALDLAGRIAFKKNESADLSSRQQVYLARKKRLEIEKLKNNEESSAVQADLCAAQEDIAGQQESFNRLSRELSDKEAAASYASGELASLNEKINAFEKKICSLLSHKEFLDKLKAEYDGIGESMNALVYLDKMPSEKTTGLVLKIKEYLNLEEGDKPAFAVASFKASGEAKPIDLDTAKICEKIEQIKNEIELFKKEKDSKESYLRDLEVLILRMKEELRAKEIELANKKAQLGGIKEQFNKFNDEAQMIELELGDLSAELAGLEAKSGELKNFLAVLENEEKANQDLIHREQENISLNNQFKEEAVILSARSKSEIEGLEKRLSSDRDTLLLLEDTCRRDREMAQAIEEKVSDNLQKSEALSKDIAELELKRGQAKRDIEGQNELLGQAQEKYKGSFAGCDGLLQNIEAQNRQLDDLKNYAHELEMKEKEADYRYLSLKERMIQAYKIDLDEASQPCQEGAEDIRQKIEDLKNKLDSYGTVNLVAIEEYDELKKRYDFLNQQQADLFSAKDCLHEAILKINRTTKQMFIETFEKVKLEFRSYFRLLFNGGDAQVFLVDENDPLESGIEIICRPPGKKLQNVLLLSGGEKSMAAIALIFAIFKIKPAPFCVLDEIDAALDEANVDRYSRLLQEFARQSQFIAITHNKKTIANADVMYGITMEESGVSKIVSVKFAKAKPAEAVEPDMALA